jgi:putative ABC transport system permease protein
MTSFFFAVRSLVRQPGRTALGMLGIAAVGALLFDMLLLSRGLVVSFRDLLDRVGFDVRVTVTDGVPYSGPRIEDVSRLADELAALPEVASVVPVLTLTGEASREGGGPVSIALTGVDVTGRTPWTVIDGRDITAPLGPDDRPLVVSRRLAERLRVSPGEPVTIRGACAADRGAPVPLVFQVVGVAEFPFDDAVQFSAATTRSRASEACGDTGRDDADMLMVASREGIGPDAAVAAISRRRPELHPATNEQLVARMERTGFTYFRQISAVLSAITMLFGFLLIAVLLTVSVNQRVAEIAALRALGFSRRRASADVMWQSVLLVGAGGVLAVPVGWVLSLWLDRILKAMPGLPVALHFFVFEPQALVWHAGLLVATAVLAAVYPVWLVSNLPITKTLRDEVVS